MFVVTEHWLSCYRQAMTIVNIERLYSLRQAHDTGGEYVCHHAVKALSGHQHSLSLCLVGIVTELRERYARARRYGDGTTWNNRRDGVRCCLVNGRDCWSNILSPRPSRRADVVITTRVIEAKNTMNGMTHTATIRLFKANTIIDDINIERGRRTVERAIRASGYHGGVIVRRYRRDYTAKYST